MLITRHELLDNPARWHIMPHDLGPTPTGEDFFACVNLWMLDQALAYGTRKVRFINYFGYLGQERGLPHGSRIWAGEKTRDAANAVKKKL